MRNMDRVEARQGNHDFLIGVICGAAVGTAVGMLVATKPGAELRQQVVDSARKLSRQAGRTYEQAAAAVSDVVERGQSAFKRGRETFEEVRQQFDHDDFRTTHTSDRIS